MTVDIRSKLNEQLLRLIDEAIVDDAKAQAISKLDSPWSEPLKDWPTPTADACALAVAAVRQAIPCVQLGATRLGITTLSSGTESYPLNVPNEPPSNVIYRAPLAWECLDGDAKRGLVELIAKTYSPEIKHLWKDEEGLLIQSGLRLVALLNRYLELEANLWWLAREGGFTDPPPYTVRYATARWLWSPQIAGVVFCLRCGSEVRYHRAARSDNQRRPRCRTCSRGQDVASWPRHAIAPAEQGTWWLNCLALGCRNPHPFVGRRNQARCSECDSSRTTPRRRTPLRRT